MKTTTVAEARKTGYVETQVDGLLYDIMPSPRPIYRDSPASSFSANAPHAWFLGLRAHYRLVPAPSVFAPVFGTVIAIITW